MVALHEISKKLAVTIGEKWTWGGRILYLILNSLTLQNNGKPGGQEFHFIKMTLVVF